jgi:hypothetical protein
MDCVTIDANQVIKGQESCSIKTAKSLCQSTCSSTSVCLTPLATANAANLTCSNRKDYIQAGDIARFGIFKLSLFLLPIILYLLQLGNLIFQNLTNFGLDMTSFSNLCWK